MIQLVCLGRMKTNRDYAGLADLTAMYLKRIQPWCQTHLIELPESPHRDTQLAQQQEAALLAPYMAKAGRILLFTEHGHTMTSQAWSNWLSTQRDIYGFSATSPWVWIIAGPTGPAATVVAQSHDVISLSPMTYPHLIARLLVVEQLYRGLSMQNNVNYHK